MIQTYDELGEYIRQIANMVGLRDWTLVLSDDGPPEDDYDACVDVVYGRKLAKIHFPEGWEKRDPEAIRQTTVHELMHCHLKPTEWALNNIGNALGVIAFNVIEGAYSDALEVAVDAIATEWAELLPLPIKDDEGESA